VSSADKGKIGKPVVAIDGPAGSGKSTVAKQAARALGFDYVDTGAMYRAVTLAALRSDVDPEDGKALGRLAKKSAIAFRRDEVGSQKVTLNGQDITDGIRMPDVTANVSAVSAHTSVRNELVNQQRDIAETADKGAVVEGRDVGTVVFPRAMLKIYLDASIEERARRRRQDMAAVGVKVDDEELVKLLKKRDEMDSSRDASPLVKAADAVVVDTTVMSVDEAVGLVVRLAQERTGDL
jgi:cytidylate kinase